MPGHVAASIGSLRSTIASLEENLQQLKRQLTALESEQLRPTVNLVSPDRPNKKRKVASDESIRDWNVRLELDIEEYKRYGRQMIIPGFGLQGQLNLKHARVLIIGVGGLGSPAAAYLAGAGIGTLGLVDGDTVEVSNLHRQIIHTKERVGKRKVESAVEYLKQLNPKPNYIQHDRHLEPATIFDIIKDYDILLDCTDHPTSRYMIGDAAVLAKKMLITASATQTHGQLMTLGHGWDNQPCYRCIYPNSPSADTVQSCSESGILGPAVGAMGILMAVETIKMLTHFGAYDENEKWSWKMRTSQSTLLLYSAYDVVPFRTTYLKTKPRYNCAVCSPQATITEAAIRSGEMDYKMFCGMTAPINILSELYRESAKDFHDHVRGTQVMVLEHVSLEDTPGYQYDPYGSAPNTYVLVDVREEQDFDMCHIEGSFNLPYSFIERAIRNPGSLANVQYTHNRTNRIWELKKWITKLESLPDLYFICRYGNDSQKAVDFFVNNFNKEFQCLSLILPPVTVRPEYGALIQDIKGGLRAWSKVDPTFPEY